MSETPAALAAVQAIAAALAAGDLATVAAEIAAIKSATDTLAAMKLSTDKITKPRYVLDAWSSAASMLPTLAFSTVASDKDFPSVIVPASYLPTGATILAVYPMLKFGSRIDSSGALNYVNAASKSIRVKLSTGAWGTDDMIAMTLVNGCWRTQASLEGPGDVKIGTVDVSGKVTSDNVTVNFRTVNTIRADSIVVLAASLTLQDVETGLRYVYTV